MTRGTSSARYVIVSPVKDEESYVDLTLRCVTAQTLKPLLWVIVDDGSTDSTPDIVRRYTTLHPFIRLIHGSDRGCPRQPGGRVIHAFNRGRAYVADEQHDFIVKLDCDMSFQPDYFEKLLTRFLEDERLGIASGVYSEVNGAAAWKPVKMPPYHACGASKVLRRACFEDIGGFVTAKGWDTVDEIRAWNKGWTTRHFTDLELQHHKREGSGIGLMRTSMMHGHIYYVTGGDPLFFVFKVLRRLIADPPLFNALGLVCGYVNACVKRTSRLVTAGEMRCYRKRLRDRLWRCTRKPFTLRPIASGR